MKECLLLLLFVSGCLAFNMSQYSPTNPNVYVDNYYTLPLVVEPGEDFTLYAVLTNGGQNAAANVNFTLRSNSVFKLKATDTSTKIATSIPPGAYVVLQYNLVTAPQTLSDDYELKGVITYSEQDLLRSVYSEDTVLKIRVAGTAALQVSTGGRAMAKPGAVSDFVVTLSNQGSGAAYRISATLSSVGNVLLPVDYTTAYIDELAANASENITFKTLVSASASAQAYNPTLQLHYWLENGTEVTSNSTLVFMVEKWSPLSLLSVDVPVISPGQSGDEISLAFNSPQELHNIQLSWNSTASITPWNSSNTIFIESMHGIEQVRILVSASPSITAGTYTILLMASYYDSYGNHYNDEMTIGVVVGGETDFTVLPQDSSSSGMSLSVANIGVNPASSVVVKVMSMNGTQANVSGTQAPPDMGQRQRNFSGGFSASPNMTGVGSEAQQTYIGTLNPGDYTVVTLSAAGASQLMVEIDYTDTLGVRRTVTKRVAGGASSLTGQASGQMSQQFGGRGGTNYWNYILPAAALMALGAAYWKRKTLVGYWKRRKAPARSKEGRT
jgi:hypothetical protein